MQFSGKVRLMVILKVTKKKQGFTLFLEDIFLEKPQWESTPPPPPPPPPSHFRVKTIAIY